jgi:hypothetical protein
MCLKDYTTLDFSVDRAPPQTVDEPFPQSKGKSQCNVLGSCHSGLLGHLGEKITIAE